MTKTIFLKIYISQLPDQVHQWYRDDSYDGTESNLKEMYCLFQKNWHLDDQTLETVIKGLLQKSSLHFFICNFDEIINLS